MGHGRRVSCCGTVLNSAPVRTVLYDLQLVNPKNISYSYDKTWKGADINTINQWSIYMCEQVDTTLLLYNPAIYENFQI